MCAVSSDSSGYFETTYSQDERIEKEINNAKQRVKAAKKQVERNRQQEFEEFFSSKNHDIFDLTGLHFSKFTHRKIKFKIVPSEIRDFISKKVVIYCSLQYLSNENYWIVRRDTFPANCKLMLRTSFTKKTVDDESLLYAILQLYKLLMKWAIKEEERLIDRAKKYVNGEIEDVDLTSEDEELFLNDDEKENLFQRRQAILRRMIPPVRPKPKKRRRKKDE